MTIIRTGWHLYFIPPLVMYICYPLILIKMMNQLTKRNLLRVCHFIGAGFMGAYMYSPFTEFEWFVLLVKIVVFPSLALSGIWMWKGHKIRAFFISK